MNRYEFLGNLHDRLKPRGYLEIGVQTGASLRLASCPAIGIDPRPQVRYALHGQVDVVEQDSDVFFASHGPWPILDDQVDLAFIDGMHLVEYALRDFMNVEQHSNDRTVVVFDDVLPRNKREADRQPLPGDWTGDVWKIHRILEAVRPDLILTLVDTDPTGVLVVRGLDRSNFALQAAYDPVVAHWIRDHPVPPEVLVRRAAVQPETVLQEFA